jgi:hypothetical protein
MTFLLLKHLKQFNYKTYINLPLHLRINYKSNFGTHVVFHKSKYTNPIIKKLN